MSYTKNTWVTGDTITATKLNNMENGIEAAAGDFSGFDLVIWYDYGTWTPTLVKGNYASLRQKIVEGSPVAGLLGASGEVAGLGSVGTKCSLAEMAVYDGYITVYGLYIEEAGFICKFNADGTITDDSD